MRKYLFDDRRHYATPNMIEPKGFRIPQSRQVGGKPSWSYAPPWAQWLAQDGNGKWHWFRSRPSYAEGQRCWATPGDGLRQCAGQAAPPADAWDTRKCRPASKTDAQDRNERQVAVNELQAVRLLAEDGSLVAKYVEKRIKELLR